jgi:hypothetical protein
MTDQRPATAAQRNILCREASMLDRIAIAAWRTALILYP